VRLGGAVYDVPCHRQPVFAELAGSPLPRAEHLCPRQVCPPIYPSLTDDDARYVAESLIEVVS
jgi:dTDP-4-amino-4,6-dideoxygalactose transaminase